MGFRVWGMGFRVRLLGWGLELGVQGLGLGGSKGLDRGFTGVRVSGLGLTV